MSFKRITIITTVIKLILSVKVVLGASIWVKLGKAAKKGAAIALPIVAEEVGVRAVNNFLNTLGEAGVIAPNTTIPSLL